MSLFLNIKDVNYLAQTTFSSTNNPQYFSVVLLDLFNIWSHRCGQILAQSSSGESQVRHMYDGN